MAVRSSAPSTFWPRPVFSRALVAIHDEERRSYLVVSHRRHPAALAAAQALDPYDVGPQISEERGTVRPGNVPSEIEDPNTCEDAVLQTVGFAHPVLPFSVVAGLEGLTGSIIPIIRPVPRPGAGRPSLSAIGGPARRAPEKNKWQPNARRGLRSS